MNKMGLVFNIQRYSLNDGNGIRTMVFLKGCSLRCPWCSNPESQSEKIEIMVNKEKAEKYRNLVGANEISSEVVGKWYSVDDLINEVLKDEIFFNTSGGGVTLSGGEILNQADFSREFLKELKENGINTAIETCGYGDIQMIIEIMKNSNINDIDILPYHNYGSKKYENLNRKYLLEDLEIPSDTEIYRVKKIFEKSGFIVNIGG